MKTEFKDVAHLYLGCRIHLDNHTDGCTYSTLEGFDPFDGCTLLHWGDDDQVGYRTDEVQLGTLKPILKSLSDITAGDALAMINLQYEGYLKPIPISCSNSVLLFEFEYNSSKRRRKERVYYNKLKSSQFTYLLSKGYDLHELILSGQAIKK